MEKTFKHKTNGTIATYKGGVFKQGNFCIEIGCEPSSEFWEELTYEIITEKPCVNIGSSKIEIIEVKRLSDNVVFKRGDLTNAGKIKIFELHGEHLMVKTDGGLTNFDDDLCLKKEPIITTFDEWLYQAIEIFCNGKKDPHNIYPLIDLASAKLSFIDGMTSEEYSYTIDI